MMGVFLMLASGCKKDDPSKQLPALTTSSINNITKITATCEGNITSEGGSKIIVKGICWSTGENPTITDSKTTDGSDARNFTNSIIGLNPNTTYYVRAYATNSEGTGYGSGVSFKTKQGIIGIVTDINGNVYHTVTIGTQVWMVENLKTTKFRDGTNIPNVTDQMAWYMVSNGASYCNYGNDANNSKTYGRLYNWYAINDSRKLAPIGWHIPTVNEFQTLIDYLGGRDGASTKLKETGTSHWANTNTGATNEADFAGLPGGWRNEAGVFEFIGKYCCLWTSSSANPEFGEYFEMTVFTDYAYNDQWEYMRSGLSVRCIKD